MKLLLFCDLQTSCIFCYLSTYFIFLLFLCWFEQQHFARHNALLEFHEKEFSLGSGCVSFKLVSSKMRIVFCGSFLTRYLYRNQPGYFFNSLPRLHIKPSIAYIYMTLDFIFLQLLLKASFCPSEVTSQIDFNAVSDVLSIFFKFLR